VFSAEASIIQSLVKSGQVDVLGPNDQDPEGCLKSHVNEDFQTLIKVVGLIDIKLEIQRITKRQNELTKLMDGLKKKMNVPGYEQKVPEGVRKENQDKFDAYSREFSENEKSQNDLSKFL
jgi:valyl-tRNA synthetase